MGCGSSTAGRAGAPMSKDPTDYTLDAVDFQIMGIPKFDDFLDQVEKPVNTVVGICNTINDCISDVQEATGMVLGAWQVEVKYDEKEKDHDHVHFHLLKADGTYPTPDEVKAIEGAVKGAEAKLMKAKKALHAVQHSKPLDLKVAADLLTVAPPSPDAPAPEVPEVKAVNDALTELRAAAGATMKVVVKVLKAGMKDSAGISVKSFKPIWKEGKEDPEKQDLGLLDVALTKQAKAFNDAKDSVALAVGVVVKALKALPKSEYTFEIVRKRKLVVKFPPKQLKKSASSASAGGDGGDGGEPCAESVERVGFPIAEGEEDKKEGDDAPAGDAPAEGGDAPAEDAPAEGDDAPAEDAPAEGGDTPAEDAPAEGGAEGGAAKKAAAKKAPGKRDEYAEKKMALKKAVGTANAQIFKLTKACASVNGDVNLAKGVVVLFEALKKKVLELKKADPSASMANIIKFEPKIDFKDGELDFDFDVTFDVDELKGQKLEDAIKKLLPAKCLHLYKTILAIKDKIKATFPEFSKLKDQASELIDSADQVFENATDTIKEALGDSLSPMELLKMGKAAMGNLSSIKDCAVTIQMFLKTVMRIKDELSASFDEVKKVLA